MVHLKKRGNFTLKFSTVQGDFQIAIEKGNGCWSVPIKILWSKILKVNGHLGISVREFQEVHKHLNINQNQNKNNQNNQFVVLKDSALLRNATVGPVRTSSRLRL